VARRRAIVGGVAAVVLIGGGVFLATRDGDGGILDSLPIIGADSGPPTPKFAFDIAKVKVNTTTETRSKKVLPAAKEVADRVRTSLDVLYFDGFVDPDHWDGADYDDVWDVFEDGAKDQAKSDVQTLTLGEEAGDVYDFVQPDKGLVTVNVLTGSNDEPTQALAKAFFAATATHDDGSYTKITSRGTFFLRQVDGGWRIFSYEVDRKEKATRAPKSSSSSSASGSAGTPTGGSP
jgi:hypothetical protein